MIFTTYYARMGALPAGVTPIAVSNTVPCGIHLAHMPQYAPPWHIINAYKVTGDRETFVREYTRWLDFTHGQDPIPVILASESVALICYERNPDECHRSVLAEWFAHKYNLTWQEWGCAS